MNSLLRTAAVSVLLLAAIPSSAAVLEYRFTTAIDSLWEYDGVTEKITFVDESDMAGVRFAMGDPFSGSFSYATDMQRSRYQPEAPITGTYRMYSGEVLSHLDFAGSASRFGGPGSTVQVADNASTFSGWDVFALHATAAYSPVDFQSFALNLFDKTGTVFASDAVPGALPLAAFHYANVDYAWLRRSDGSQMHASGRLTSLELVPSASEVPVAPTAWLFAAGLPMLLTLRPRRR